jgi:hypothetical protein
MSSEAKAIACALSDCAMVLAPRGWTQLTLQFGSDLTLSSIATKGEGVAEPPKKPNLRIDLAAEAWRLSEGAAALREVLREAKKVWTAGSIEFSRSESSSDIRVLNADGTMAWFHRFESAALKSMLMTEELFALLLGTELAFEHQQVTLSQTFPNAIDFAYDAESQVLRLREANGKETHADALLLGQFFVDDSMWSWGWADEQVEPAAIERVRQICSPNTQPPGLSALYRPHYQCDQGFSFTVCGSVCVSLGARGLVRMPVADKSASVFFALM